MYPPHRGEQFSNWRQSAAGAKENEPGWVYVPPTPGTLTVFPGKHESSSLAASVAQGFIVADW